MKKQTVYVSFFGYIEYGSSEDFAHSLSNEIFDSGWNNGQRNCASYEMNADGALTVSEAYYEIRDEEADAYESGATYYGARRVSLGAAPIQLVPQIEVPAQHEIRADFLSLEDI